MGMFSRMSDIIQANINAMLDKAEDPQKIIKLIVQEMEASLVELRSVAARGLADQKLLDRQISAASSKVEDWQSKAELSLQKGREDLARAALVQKNDAETRLAALQQERETLAGTLEGLKEDTVKLNQKLQEARAKQKALAVRQQSASVRLKARNVAASEQVADVVSRFEQCQAKVDALEAKVDAYDVVPSAPSLEAEITALHTQDRIEQELEALRKKVA